MSLAPCAIHGVDEDDTGAYQACGECWHVWPTEADLLADHNHRARELFGVGRPPSPLTAGQGSRIAACPLCAHDF